MGKKNLRFIFIFLTLSLLIINASFAPVFTQMLFPRAANADTLSGPPDESGTFSVNITIVGQGNVTKNPDQPYYNEGGNVTLTAVPDAGWTFSGWSDALWGNANPITITMDSNKNVTAVFSDPPPADWWNTSWNERVDITINELSGASLLSYQVKIHVPYNGNMNPDFSDIRFVSDDNQTELSYWRQSFVDSTEAYFWVKVRSIPASGTADIYMYYGNPSAATTSNIHTTFIFGDDFEDATWTANNLNAVNYWGATQYVQGGVYHMSGPSTSEPLAEPYENGALKQFPLNYVAEIDFSPVILAGGAYLAPRYFGTGNKYECWAYVEQSYAYFSIKNNEAWTEPAYAPLNITISAGNWYSLKTSITGDGTTNHLKIYVNDQLYIDVNDSTLHYNGFAFLTYDWNESFHMVYDNFRIREYASIEPSYTLGQEENYSGSPGPHTLNIIIVGQGTVTKNLDQSTYDDGSSVTLTATPATGYTFSGWSGSITGTTNPVTITMDSDKTITATFTVISTTPVKYENYAVANAIDIFYGVNWRSQTFTPQTTHTLTKVRLPILKQGSPGGNVQVSIRATDASGRPTDGDLATGSVTCASVTQTWSEIWYDFDLGTGCQVQAGTKYAIVFNAPSADESNPLYFWFNTGDGYSGGWVMASADSGTSWIDLNLQAWDADFEEWGITGAPVNHAPVLNPIGNKTVTAGNLLQFTISGSDPDGDTLTYSASNLPSGSSFNPATSTFTWTPLEADTGVYPNCYFQVSDGSLTDSEDITITVLSSQVVQSTLTINITGQGMVSKNPDQTTYSDGSNVTLTATPASGYTFSGWSGDISGTTNPATITMNNNKNVTAIFTASSTSTLYENYTTANAIDIFYGTNWKGQTFTPQVTHTITKVSLPLLKQGSPGGNVMVSIWATNSNGRPAGSALAVGSFSCANIAASWSEVWYDFDLGAGCQVQAGTKYAIVFSAAGADSSNPLYFWLNINDGYAGGWVVASADGTNWIDLSSQGRDADFEEWGTSGGHVDQPPVLNSIGNKTVTAGNLLQFTISGSDPDGDTLTYSASNLPSGSTFNTSTRTFAWTPLESDTGIYPNCYFQVSDGSLIDFENITITVLSSQVTQRTLTINITGQGTVSKNPDQTAYADGSNVTLTATPASGYTFSGWSGDITGTSNPVTIIMNSDKTVTATFTISGTLTKYENYTTANAIDIFYGTNWKGQTFTPQVTHTLTKVRLPLLKQGNPGGSVIVNIYTTDSSGLPTGSPIAYGSILCSDIAASWAETWYDISLGSEVQVQAGVKYAIIFSAPSADANNPLYYWVNTSDGYAGGWVVASDGTAWFSLSSQGWDADFEEWGQ